MRYRLICFGVLLLSFLRSQAQDRDWVLNGYVKDMQLFYYAEPTKSWTNQNLIHNRLNFKWYTSNSLTMVVEVRNRLFMGKLVRDFPGYADMLEHDSGFFDLTTNIADGKGYIVNTMVDRLYLDYAIGKWQIRFGRQRINWGINLVWNPNDVFNAFSFLDFDYEERPGTDALMVQYYTGATSSAELVYQLGDHADEMALAGRFRFNRWDYDFQVIGGWVENDLVLGAGWAGDIKGGGFRGEITWFTPRDGRGDDVVVASVSGDYSFRNNLYIHGGGLFNSSGPTSHAGSYDIFTSGDRSPKMLSRGKYALFAQVAYPITPLFNADFSAIANPTDGSLYLGPSLGYSLQKNLDLLLMGQVFLGDHSTEYGDIGQALYLRLKWSF